MGTLAIPIVVGIVFATVFIAVPRLRERQATRRNNRAVTLRFQREFPIQPVSHSAIETTASVDPDDGTVTDAPNGR